VYAHVHKRKSSRYPKSSTLEPEGQQHDRQDACVIAQQYSSAIIVSLRSHSHNEKFGENLKNVTSSFIAFKKMRKSEIA
jgi:hypothetical protein